MNYLILLSELAKEATVDLTSCPDGTWSCGVDGVACVYSDTPEGAIRAAYLAVNPIEPNLRDGSLKETD